MYMYIHMYTCNNSIENNHRDRIKENVIYRTIAINYIEEHLLRNHL